jgi:hypothetical protein
MVLAFVILLVPLSLQRNSRNSFFFIHPLFKTKKLFLSYILLELNLATGMFGSGTAEIIILASNKNTIATAESNSQMVRYRDYDRSVSLTYHQT